MNERLFALERQRREAREWGRWLPVAAPPRCVREWCDAPLIRLNPAIQPAMFIHGGYGAAERYEIEMCPGCGWSRTVSTETLNPRKLDV